jgi:selenocysteine lyase/cysteine desulfurase
MAITALEQILDWQIPRIAATLAKRTSDIARQATRLGFSCESDDQRGPHMLGLRLPDHARAHASEGLASVNCFAAIRGNSLRISPHLHTTDDDVRRLIDGLALALQPSGQ